MNKIERITSIMVVSLFVSMSIASVVGAEETLTGDISVEINGWIGVVSPRVNIEENQSVNFSVDVVGEGDNTTYTVNDSLRINLNITDGTNRTNFILPRSMSYSIIVCRKPLDIKLLPVFGLLDRLFPVRVLFKSVSVASSVLGGEKSDNITVNLSYSISNMTFENGENLTMHIWVMGFLPGNVNGVIKGLPIIGHKVVNLNVEYREKV